MGDENLQAVVNPAERILRNAELSGQFTAQELATLRRLSGGRGVIPQVLSVEDGPLLVAWAQFLLDEDDRILKDILRRYPNRAIVGQGERNNLAGLPRFWHLFSYILSRKTRERVFEPAFNEMLGDYLETRGRYRTRSAKRWLKLVFTVKTVGMVCGCLRAAVTDKVLRAFLGLLPRTLREWLLRLF